MSLTVFLLIFGAVCGVLLWAAAIVALFAFGATRERARQGLPLVLVGFFMMALGYALTIYLVAKFG